MDCNALKQTVAELSMIYEQQQKHIQEIEQQIKDKQKEIEKEEQKLKDCEGARAETREPQVIDKPINELTTKDAKDNLQELLRVSKLRDKYYGAVGRPSRTANVTSKLFNGWKSVKVEELNHLMHVSVSDNRKAINFDGHIYTLPVDTQDQVLYIFNNDIKTLTADAKKVIVANYAGPMANYAIPKKGGKKKTYKRNPR